MAVPLLDLLFDVISGVSLIIFSSLCCQNLWVLGLGVLRAPRWRGVASVGLMLLGSLSSVQQLSVCCGDVCPTMSMLSCVMMVVSTLVTRGVLLRG